MTTLAEVKQSAEIARLQESNSALSSSMEILQESFADAMLALDDVGWRPLGPVEDAAEIRLDTVKNISQNPSLEYSVNKCHLSVILNVKRLKQAMFGGKKIYFAGSQIGKHFCNRLNLN